MGNSEARLAFYEPVILRKTKRAISISTGTAAQFCFDAAHKTARSVPTSRLGGTNFQFKHTAT